MPKYPMHSTALPAEKFIRSQPANETTMSSAEYTALLKAASEKNKLPQFLKWQRNRKIILKG